MQSMNRIICLIPIIAFVAGYSEKVGENDAASRQRSGLRLAVSSSTTDSGLLDVLIPPFEAKHGIRIEVIPVGTGKALQLGEAGDVDLALVHSPSAELPFMIAVRNYFGNERYRR